VTSRSTSHEMSLLALAGVALMFAILSWSKSWNTSECNSESPSELQAGVDAKHIIELLEAQKANTVMERRLTSLCKAYPARQYINSLPSDTRISMVSECIRLGVTWM
jgi:hypothetical protein